MKYRILGKTGLEVSILSFGGSSLGSVFREVEEEQGIRAVRVALDHGINLIDTAPFYGLTKAEVVLGKALRDIPRSSYLLATKVGRYGQAAADFDFSAARVTLTVEESLQRLGIDHVDFIQVHDMEFGDLNQIIEETLPALRRIQEQGKARFVGITGFPIKIFREVMDRTEVDQIQSYCHYCLNDTALTDLLPYLEEKGVAIFSSAPVAMRLLTDAGPPSWHPAPEELRVKCAKAARYCRDRGRDLSALALQFSVANPRIHTTVVGTASPSRIVQNIREIEEPLDEELLADVRTILAPIHNKTWLSGRPENN